MSEVGVVGTEPQEGTPLLKDPELGEEVVGSVPPVEQDAEKSTGKKKTKKKKKGGMPNDIKTSLQSERTFFKFVWTGFHLGAIGTFILAFFSGSGFIVAKLLLVLFTWVVAFSFVVYGLVTYYRRRRALRLNLSARRDWDNPYGPFAVVGAIVLELLAVVLFAWYTDSHAESV